MLLTLIQCRPTMEQIKIIAIIIIIIIIIITITIS